MLGGNLGSLLHGDVSVMKVQTDVIDKLLYADDMAENAKSEEKMQGAVDRMSKACDNLQLTISTKRLR